MQTLACLLLLTCAAAPPQNAGRPRLQLGSPAGRHAQLRSRGERPIILSPDRKLLATNGPGDTADVYDALTDRRLFRFQHDRPDGESLTPLAFSHDGKTLATLFDNGERSVSLWPQSRNARPRFLWTPKKVERVGPYEQPDKLPFSAAFLPGDKQLATYDGETLVVWDVATRTRLRADRLRSSQDVPHLSPDGRLFAVQVGGSLVLNDLVASRWWRIALPARWDGMSVRWSWSGDGRLLALAANGQVRIVEARTGRLSRQVRARRSPWPVAALSPDGRTLAVESRRGVRIHAVQSGKRVRDVPLRFAEWFGVMQLAFLADDRLMGLDELDNEYTFDLKAGKSIAPAPREIRPSALVFASDGRTLVSACPLSEVIRWDVASGRKLSETKAHHEDSFAGLALSLSADGSRAALLFAWPILGGDEGKLACFDVHADRISWQESAWLLPLRRESGKTPEAGPFGFSKIAPRCSLSPDGRFFAAPRRVTSVQGREDEGVLVYDAGGRLLWAFECGDNPKQAFAPDSRELALTVDKTSSSIRLIDLHSGKVRLTLNAGPRSDVEAIAFSRDGRLVAAQSGCVQVWERASGRGIDRVALPATAETKQLVVRPDGCILALLKLGRDELRPAAYVVWDVNEGRELRRTVVCSDFGPCVLSPDGRTLALNCEDGTILVYDVPDVSRREPKRPDNSKRLWAELSADRAWSARQRLAGAPTEALALLRKHLKPAAAKAMPELADLDAEDFGVREAALTKLASALEKGDRAIASVLRALVAKPPSLEASMRARRLLAQAPSVPFSADELRLIRAVGVLEQVASADAVALLKRLAAGGPSLLTDEARSALVRLSVS